MLEWLNNLTSTITSHQQRTNLPASPSNQEMLTTIKWRHKRGKVHVFSRRPRQNSAAAAAARKAWSAPKNLQKDEEEAKHSSPISTMFPAPLKTKPKRKAQRTVVRQAKKPWRKKKVIQQSPTYDCRRASPAIQLTSSQPASQPISLLHTVLFL